MKRLIILLSILFSTGYNYPQIWEQTNGPTNGVVWAIGIDDDDIIYAADNAILYRSKDDGDSWEFVKDWSSVSSEIVSIVFNDSSDIIVGTWGGEGVYRSTDGGETWLNSTFTLPGVNAVTVSPNSGIIAGTMQDVWISTDNGYTWEQRNEGLPDQTIVMSVFVDDEDNYFIGTYSAEERIYKSTDFGMSWFGSGNGVGFIAVLSFEKISNNILFAGSSDALGIHRSTDGGSFWEYITNGLPITAVDYKVKSNNIDYIYIGTASFGIYRSTDEGDTWFDYSDGLINDNILSMELNSKGVLFAGTFGDGIYRTIQSTLSVEIVSTNIPNNFYLFQNFPNPFNPITRIDYSIKINGAVTLLVYDILGREVATLVNEKKPAGNYSVEFNAAHLPSGIYIYKLTAGTFTDTKKLILLK